MCTLFTIWLLGQGLLLAESRSRRTKIGYLLFITPLLLPDVLVAEVNDSHSAIVKRMELEVAAAHKNSSSNELFLKANGSIFLLEGATFQDGESKSPLSSKLDQEAKEEEQLKQKAEAQLALENQKQRGKPGVPQALARTFPATSLRAKNSNYTHDRCDIERAVTQGKAILLPTTPLKILSKKAGKSVPFEVFGDDHAPLELRVASPDGNEFTLVCYTHWFKNGEDIALLQKEHNIKKAQANSISGQVKVFFGRGVTVPPKPQIADDSAPSMASLSKFIRWEPELE